MKFRKKPVVIDAARVSDVLEAAAHRWKDLPDWIEAAYDHVVFVLHPGQWIPAFKPEEVWQTTSLSETGFQCARRGY